MLSRLPIVVVTLIAATLAARPAAAEVTSIRNAAILVSAHVVSSCAIDTSLAAQSCSGVAPGRIGTGFAADLPQPTVDETASPAGTTAMSITY